MQQRSLGTGGVQPILDVVRAQHSGQALGITSVCSANEFVLRAALSLAKRRGGQLLVESTCNQVNQDGGYTGLTPAGFWDQMLRLAAEADLPASQLTLGGDHLGPYVWRDRPAAEAMAKASQLVGDCVRAGYRKIHLDTSMACADDPPGRPLPVPVAAARAAQLAQAAEAACDPEQRAGHRPLYVIGTEVPLPGGTAADDHGPQLSSPEAVTEMIEITRKAFLELGLEQAWGRVAAVVVQPGVEYSDQQVFYYDSERARPLARLIEGQPGLIYEVHSTDYQRRHGLRQMVRDHFAVLKVGPALTYAFRQAVLALARMERDRLPDLEHSNLEGALEAAMRADPRHWQGYYRFDPQQPGLVRRDGYSDRSRYYWSAPSVRQALGRLLSNLSRRPIPQGWLSDWPSGQSERAAPLPDDPQTLIADSIQAVLEDYAFACGQGQS